jgi:hypothetical protein
MPIEICNAFAPTCSPDWDGVAAIATAAATAAALFIPFWQRRQDRNEKRRALAYSLFLKTIKIHSDIFKLWEHVREQRMLAQAHGAPPDVWGFFRPLASVPTSVVFSSDELALLFAAKDDEAFNAVLSMDEVHASDMANMQTYAEKRDALTQLLPGGVMSGPVGSIDLTEEQYLRFAPFSVQLDMLVADIAASVERHASETEDAVRRLHGVLTNKLGMKIGLTLPKDMLSSDHAKTADGAEDPPAQNLAG